jgi:hypothetical protein
MIFNNLHRFNNTLTLIIIQFNIFRETVNYLITIDNRERNFSPGNSDINNKLDKN